MQEPKPLKLRDNFFDKIHIEVDHDDENFLISIENKTIKRGYSAGIELDKESVLKLVNYLNEALKEMED